MNTIPSVAERLEFYRKAYDECVVTADVKDQASKILAQMAPHSFTYAQIGWTFRLPWLCVSVIHQMECGMDFEKHLANGDPLTGNTVHAPKNLMSDQFHAPYSFVDAGIEALKWYKAQWSGNLSVHDIPSALQFLDQWNGLGYWEHAVNNPYLWCGTDKYTKGKYATDGNFDPELVSTQIGVVALAKVVGLK